MGQATISSHAEQARFEESRRHEIGDLGVAAGILLGFGLSLVLWQALVLLVLGVFR
jgi:hypothetical protein